MGPEARKKKKGGKKDVGKVSLREDRDGLMCRHEQSEKKTGGNERIEGASSQSVLSEEHVTEKDEEGSKKKGRGRDNAGRGGVSLDPNPGLFGAVVKYIANTRRGGESKKEGGGPLGGKVEREIRRIG